MLPPEGLDEKLRACMQISHIFLIQFFFARRPAFTPKSIISFLESDDKLEKNIREARVRSELLEFLIINMKNWTRGPKFGEFVLLFLIKRIRYRIEHQGFFYVFGYVQKCLFFRSCKSKTCKISFHMILGKKIQYLIMTGYSLDSSFWQIIFKHFLSIFQTLKNFITV